MVDVNLIYREGKFIPASRIDLANVREKFEDGERVRGKIDKARSVKQSNFFHVVCQQAWNNQQSGPEFPTWEHLKGWLLIQAGWCETFEVEWPDISGTKRERFDCIAPMVAGIARGLRAQRKVSYIGVKMDTKRETIVFQIPKSWAFEGELDREKAGAIVDESIERICSEIIPGTDPEELRGMAK